MEIKISPQNMLKVLVDAGMDETDAKAIILDLLIFDSNKTTSTQSARQESRSRLEQTVQKKKQIQEQETEETNEQEVEDETLQPEIPRTQIKRPAARKVNFSNFGGQAEPLR